MTSPVVSIILPVYNSEKFIEQALLSIASQELEDWELITINDGSTDATEKIIKSLSKNIQNFTYLKQENAGSYAARNKGISFAKGKYIALYDADDIWYSHHLKNCVGELEKNPNVTWVYAANKIFTLIPEKKLLEESNFYQQGKENPFLNLKIQKSGKLNILVDKKALSFQALYGLQVGPQFSVIRKSFFDNYQLSTAYRNEAADQLAVLYALSSGYKLAYINEIHGEYYIHNANSSAACQGASLEKKIAIRKALIKGYEEYRDSLNLKPFEIKAFNKRIANEYFWQLGYNLSLASGDLASAIKYFKQGLVMDPFSLSKWKTLFISYLRTKL